jgi:hypothetical protein
MHSSLLLCRRSWRVFALVRAALQGRLQCVGLQLVPSGDGYRQPFTQCQLHHDFCSGAHAKSRNDTHNDTHYDTDNDAYNDTTGVFVNRLAPNWAIAFALILCYSAATYKALKGARHQCECTGSTIARHQCECTGSTIARHQCTGSTDMSDITVIP